MGRNGLAMGSGRRGSWLAPVVVVLVLAGAITLPAGRLSAADTLPGGITCVIGAGGHATCAGSTFRGAPGATFIIQPNGVITRVNARGAIKVTPAPGYILGRFNPATGKFECVPSDVIPASDTATYALLPSSSVILLCPCHGEMQAQQQGVAVLGCSEPIAPGTQIASPRGDVVLTAPRGLRVPLIVNFNSPLSSEQFTQFSVEAPLIPGVGGVALRLDPPLLVTVPSGFSLYVFNPATRTFRSETALGASALAGLGAGRLTFHLATPGRMRSVVASRLPGARFAITHPGAYRVGPATRFHFSADLADSVLAVGNEPLTVARGGAIRLYAATFPRAWVTITAFGRAHQDRTDGAGQVEFTVAAPRSVAAPRTVFYTARVVHDRGKGKVSIVTARERFRVVP